MWLQAWLRTNSAKHSQASSRDEGPGPTEQIAISRYFKTSSFGAVLIPIGAVESVELDLLDSLLGPLRRQNGYISKPRTTISNAQRKVTLLEQAKQGMEVIEIA